MKKIINYAVLGTMAVSGIGTCAYVTYDSVHDRIISEKSRNLAKVGLGILGAGIVYGVCRVRQDDYERTKSKQESKNNEGDLEKEIKE